MAPNRSLTQKNEELVKLNYDWEKSVGKTKARLNKVCEERNKVEASLAVAETKLVDAQSAHEESVRKLKEEFEAEKAVLETALAREKARRATIYKYGVTQTIMIAR